MSKANAIPLDHPFHGSYENPSSSLASVATQLHLGSSSMSVDSVANELVRVLYDIVHIFFTS